MPRAIDALEGGEEDSSWFFRCYWLWECGVVWLCGVEGKGWWLMYPRQAGGTNTIPPPFVTCIWHLRTGGGEELARY